MSESRAPSPAVAVIGAGWLGGAVAEKLAAGGREVRATTRSGRWRTGKVGPDRVRVEPFDILRDGEGRLRTLLDGIDRAVFCFAPAKDTDRRELYVEGAKTITRACRETSLQRIVYTSSTSALERSGGGDGWVDEESAAWPQSARGRVQREAEENLRKGLERAGIPWTILRLAGLYGPGRELARIYRVGRDAPPRAGDGLERTNLVHRDDASAAILAALELAPPESGLIHVCDDDHRTRREVIDAIASIEGLPPATWEDQPPELVARGKRVHNAKMKAVLGLNLRHPTH